MANPIITLAIEKLAGLGDGMGVFEGQKVFVPYTLAGDVVKARVKRETADALYATLESVTKPGMGRIKAVCKHFTECGGCSLQHLSPDVYKDFKWQMAREAVRKAGFSVDRVAPIQLMQTASRRRVQLKYEKGKLGYYQERSHALVDIEECKVLEPALFEVILALKKQIGGLPDVTGVQINGLDKGYSVLLELSGDQQYRFPKIPGVQSISTRYKGVIRTLYSAGPDTITLGRVEVDVPAGAFLQASQGAQELMTSLIVQAVGDASHVLDLFAGIGTYSFPLAEHTKVTAMEGDKAMTEAIQAAIHKNGLDKKLTVEMRDLFYNPLPFQSLSEYDAVIINPPRAGAKAQSEQLAQSTVPKLVMVSCNPATFARDARVLKEGGYHLVRVTPIDQFIYSSHLELVAEFVRS